MKLVEVTKENIWQVSQDQAFEWVKTGEWDLKIFEAWVDTIKEDQYQCGYDSGFNSGYYQASEAIAARCLISEGI